MAATIVESNLLTADNVLSESLPIPLPQVEAGLSLFFNIPAFQLQIAIPIKDIESDMAAGKVVFSAVIDNDAIVILTGMGKLNREEDGFRIEHVNLHLERLAETARADFIISTIRAALVLADRVHLRIPDVHIDITLGFDEPLLDISQMLRRRQIDYRIMVIERAVGLEFHLPLDISGDEVHDISFAYHAIVDQSFFWPIDSITLSIPATKKWNDILARLRHEASIPIGPDPYSLKLFGHHIALGQRCVIVQDALIENFEAVQKEMSKDDGHTVPMVIRSVSGRAKHDFFGAPKPPVAIWNSDIQKMVELEPQLDARLAKGYNALAAATLSDLSEEEKKEVTIRPELGEAFLIDDTAGE